MNISNFLLFQLPLSEPPRGHPFPVGAEALNLAIVWTVCDLKSDIEVLSWRVGGEGEVVAGDDAASSRTHQNSSVVDDQHRQLKHLKIQTSL